MPEPPPEASGGPASGGPASGAAGPAVRERDGRREVLDPVRQRWVALTPEEGVRQRLLALLLSLGYPAGLLAVERKVEHLGRLWRADVVAYDRRQRPALLAECKAPGVRVDQTTFDQLARYNAVLGARALAATNGDTLLVCVREGEPGARTWRWAPGVPPFAELDGAA